jgi:hypothetical protein
MKIDNLKLLRHVVSSMTLLALVAPQRISCVPEAAELSQSVLQAKSILRACLLNFKGDDKIRPFGAYIQDVITLLVEHREEFKKEISDPTIADSSFTNKDMFMDAFIIALDNIRSSKDWKKITSTLEKFVKAIPILETVFSDQRPEALLYGIKRRLQIN